MGYIYRDTKRIGATTDLSPGERAKREMLARAHRAGATAAQAKINELQLTIDNLTACNNDLKTRVKKAEANLADALLKIRVLKVKSEQTTVKQVLQEQINALEEERDNLTATIDSLTLAYKTELKDLRSQKAVRARKDATIIKKLEAKLAELEGSTTPELLESEKPAETAAITITEHGMQLHGTWAQAPNDVLKHHLNQATYTMVTGASDAQLAHARRI